LDIISPKWVNSRKLRDGSPCRHAGGSTGRKILRFVDKITKSKYFQKATENEYIKKKIAEVSNMPLMLAVEVLELSGTLAVNIPPPPTDRIWYIQYKIQLFHTVSIWFSYLCCLILAILRFTSKGFN